MDGNRENNGAVQINGQPNTQPVYQQPVYQQPVYQQQNTRYSDSNTVSVGDWIGSLVLMCIPFVNIVMLFVWAFGKTKPSKKNFCKAMLIILAVEIGIVILVSIISLVILAITGVSVFAAFTQAVNEMNGITY